jgi:hypothetical protein
MRDQEAQTHPQNGHDHDGYRCCFQDHSHADVCFALLLALDSRDEVPPLRRSKADAWQAADQSVLFLILVGQTGTGWAGDQVRFDQLLFVGTSVGGT